MKIEQLENIAGLIPTGSLGATRDTAAVDGAGFANELTDAQSVKPAFEMASPSLLLPESGTLDLHDAMIALEQQKLKLSLMIEMRNKLVEAYQELTRMQI